MNRFTVILIIITIIGLIVYQIWEWKTKGSMTNVFQKQYEQKGRTWY